LPRQLMEATASSQRLDRAPRETRPLAPHRTAAAGRAPAHGDARRQANQSDRAADRSSPAPACRARARAVSAIDQPVTKAAIAEQQKFSALLKMLRTGLT